MPLRIHALPIPAGEIGPYLAEIVRIVVVKAEDAPLGALSSTA